MRKSYLLFEAVAKRESEKAFCASTLENDHMTVSEIWIPKSVIHPDGLEAIEEAVSGEKIEIYIADWWVRENL
jgi:hypothetical protein